MCGSFATNIALITNDGYLVVSRRSLSVGAFPGTWSASANEALSRTIDSEGRGTPNPYDVARRGLREELSVDPDEYTLSLLSFCVDVHEFQWGAIFVARLHGLTRDELGDRWGRGAPG